MTDADGRPLSAAAVLRCLLVITGVTVIAGLLVAGLLLPPVAGIGLVGKASADHFLALPTELVEPPLPQDSRILAADGSVIAVLRGPANRRPVPFREIPKSLRDAVVAIEDSRFYTHNGVDPQGLLRAALRNTEAGGVKQGGSTLTQQYVKNVLIEQAPTDQERKEAASRSIDRKLREARYALALERRLTKDQILERYLNIAYFGSGGYGVGVAAQRYFDRPVSRLTLAQSALLAGLVQSPGNYDPYRYPDTAVRRRDVVLRRMAELGMITQPQAAAAQAAPLGVVQAPPSNTPDACEPSPAPFFCDYVRRSLRADPALGATQEERDRRVYQGG
ncbi:MAG TPA: biosynthetic peptidoglycan transglycosylase, partial [Frankiaceae bacterium]|nr:biosynthetic peptidoglycan transglycosylase [Frankiaceae bacterium]